MKTSKLLAMALAIVMIVSLVPAITPSARAAEGTKILDVDEEYPDEADKSGDTEKKVGNYFTIYFGDKGEIRKSSLTWDAASDGTFEPYTRSRCIDFGGNFKKESEGRYISFTNSSTADVYIWFSNNRPTLSTGETESTGDIVIGTEKQGVVRFTGVVPGEHKIYYPSKGYTYRIEVRDEGPTVSAGLSSKSIKEKDTTAITVPVNVSGFGTGYEFFALSSNDSKVGVEYTVPSGSSDVNGTYTLTITPTGTAAKVDTVKIYAGVAESKSVPSSAGEVENSGAVYKTITLTFTDSDPGTGGTTTKQKTVIYHDYNGDVLEESKVDEDGGAYKFKPMLPEDNIEVDGIKYTLLGWSTNAEYTGKEKCLLSKEQSTNLYDFDRSVNGYKLKDDSIYDTYNIISKYDATATKKDKPTANVFEEYTITDGDVLDLYPIYVEAGDNNKVTANGPGGETITVTNVSVNDTNPRWLGLVYVKVYKDGVLQNTADDKQRMYFHYNSDNMVDIKLDLTVPEGRETAYVINAVIAEQGGSSSGKGLTKGSNYLLPEGGFLDNVIGGTTVEVYMSTRYTAEFYLDGDKQEDGSFSVFETAEYSTNENLSAFNGSLERAVKDDKPDDKYIVAPDDIAEGYKEDGFREGPKDFLTNLKDDKNTYNDDGNIEHGGKYLFGYFVKTYEHSFEVPATTATGKKTDELVNGDQWILGDGTQGAGTFNVSANVAKAPEGVFKFYAYTMGGLKVTKTVTGELAPDQEFDFSVKFTVPAGTKLPASGTGYTISGDTATFKLKNGGSVTIDKIPTGTTFTVSETSVDHFTPEITPSTGKIESGKTVAVAVTNTYTAPKSSLTVAKTVVANGSSKGTGDFTITVTFDNWTLPTSLTTTGTGTAVRTSDNVATLTLKGGQSVTMTNIPVGATYTVAETDPGDGSTPTIDKASGTIVEDADTNTVTVTNTYPAPKGSIKITKTVTSAGSYAAPSTWSFDFTVTADDVTIPDGSYGTGVTRVDDKTLTVTLSSDTPTVTIVDLPVGEYTVTETSVDNYKADSDSYAANVTEAGEVAIEVKNTYTAPGSLTVTKKVVGNTAAGKTFDFTVTFTDWSGADKLTVDGTATDVTKSGDKVTFKLADGQSAEIKGIPAGTEYTVKETEPTSDIPTKTTYSAPDGKGTIAADTVSEVTVTNYYTGSLTVTKKLEGTGSGAHSGDTFTFKVTADDSTFSGTYDGVEFTAGSATVTVTGAGTKTVSGLPAGTKFTVEEDTSALSTKPDDTTYKADGVTVPEKAEVTVAQNETSEVEVTNLYGAAGSLSITKQVSGTNLETDEHTFHYKVTLKGKDGTPITGESATCATGSVTVEETSGGVYEFDITMTGKTASATGVKFENLPYGATYELEETETSHGHVFGANFEVRNDEDNNFVIDSATNHKISGDIGDGENIEITITNTSPFGVLTVGNNVVGQPADPDQKFEYTVTISDTGYTGSIGGVRFENGSATFSVKPGETVTAYLPVGVDYTVTQITTGMTKTTTAVENTGDLGTVGAENNEVSGTTAENSSHAVTFTNYYLADLTVKKEVVGGTETEFGFTVTLTGGDLAKLPDDMKVKIGEAAVSSGTANSVTVTAGTPVTIAGIPTGTAYTVEETDSKSAEKTTYTTDAGTPTEDAPSGVVLTANTTVTVTNHYSNTGKLTITKEIAGSGDNKPTGATEFTFELVIDGSTVDVTMEDGTVFTSGKATVTVTVPAGATSAAKEFAVPRGKITVTETGTNKGDTVTYTVGGTGSTEPATVTVGADAVGVTVKNEYTKTSGGTGGDPGDDDTDEPGGTGSPSVDTDDHDHYAYIIGMPSGLVGPNENITRAEIATIIFRLLKDDVRAENWSQTNPFPDVSIDDWYNNAVSTLYKMGIIDGRGDGMFHPDDPITRAEMAALMTRLHDVDTTTGDLPSKFADVAPDAWYARYVNAAAELGLFLGYPNDPNFYPDRNLSRAEAMTVYNRLLGRHPHKDHLLPTSQMIMWPDNMDVNAWYYADVQEATNSHTCDISGATEDGVAVEKWLSRLPVRDWAALERAWSDAYSGSDGHDVG